VARYLAIDFDSPAIRIASGTMTRGQAQIEQTTSIEQAGPLSPVTAADLGKQIREALKAAKIAPAPVIVTLGRDRLTIKDIKHPPVPESEEPSLVRFQVSKELSDQLDDVIIDYTPLTNRDGSIERRALAVIARKEVIEACKEVCSAAGLKISAVVPRSFAAIAAYRHAQKIGSTPLLEDNVQTTIAVLLRTERWGELSISREGEILFSRALTGPSLNSETALQGEIRRNLTVFSSQNSQNPIQALAVAESIGSGNLSERLAVGMIVPVFGFDPLAGTPAAGTLASRASFAGVIGALALQSFGEFPINFLKPREPKPIVDPVKQRIKVFGSIGLIVGILFFGYALMLRMEKDEQISQLVAQKTTLDQDLTMLEDDSRRIKAIDEWMSRNVNWLDEIYDITQRFPDIAGTRVMTMTGSYKEPEKNAKTKYVAQIEMKIETESGKFVDTMLAEMVRDKFYRVGPKQNVPMNSSRLTRFIQQFIVRGDIERRLPKEYERALKAEAPAKKKDDEEMGGFDPFGGGFPGGN
jgi:hypothetical protein